MGFEPEKVDLKAAFGCRRKVGIWLGVVVVLLVALCAWGVS